MIVLSVGMPRAGSTLVEQILSSHSQVEGTSELPDIPILARKDGYPAFNRAHEAAAASVIGVLTEHLDAPGDEPSS